MSSEEFWAVLEEGEDYYEEGDFEAALDRFDRAVAMSPQSADAHNSRGNALMMLGRHEDALASFESSLSLEPGFVKAALNRAELFVDHMDRPEEGQAICDRLLKRPLELIDAADAYFIKAKAALTLGDLRTALAMSEKAIGLASDRPEFIALRGGILFEQGTTGRRSRSWIGPSAWRPRIPTPTTGGASRWRSSAGTRRRGWPSGTPRGSTPSTTRRRWRSPPRTSSAWPRRRSIRLSRPCASSCTTSRCSSRTSPPGASCPRTT
jgi:tetratricopeptide (TPR) repeat protein